MSKRGAKHQKPKFYYFHHRFSQNTAVSMRCPVLPPPPEKGYRPEVHWHGTSLEESDWLAFQLWAIEVARVMANNWNIALVQFYQPNPFVVEQWLCRPGEKPQKVVTMLVPEGED
jgi:hypothetical protein